MMNRTQREQNTETRKQTVRTQATERQKATRETRVQSAYKKLARSICYPVTAADTDRLQRVLFDNLSVSTDTHTIREESYNFLLSLSPVACIAEDTTQRRDSERVEAEAARYALSDVLAAAVCKKLDNVSSTEKTRELRHSRAADTHRLDTTSDAIAAEITTRTNKDGDTEIKESASYEAVAREKLYPVGDGADLREEAYLSLLENRDRLTQAQYTETVLDSRVLCRDTDSAAWKDRETTAAQAAFRAVRQYIMKNRAVAYDAKCKYFYLSEIAERDTETGEKESVSDVLERVVYRRTAAYFTETDTTGSFGTLCISEAEAELSRAAVAQSVETLAETLKLSASEKETISYTMRGYGVAATATARGKKKEQIKTDIKRIKAKAERTGVINRYTTEKAAERQAEATLYAISAADYDTDIERAEIKREAREARQDNTRLSIAQERRERITPYTAEKRAKYEAARARFAARFAAK